MSHKELLKEKALEIIRLGEKHGAQNLRVFGSVKQSRFSKRQIYKRKTKEANT